MFDFLKKLFKDFYLFTASYSNNVFPDPLSKEDEEKYIKLANMGDMEARNKLIEHNLRLVAHIVKKYDHSSEMADDLISIGTIGLIKGVDSYSFKHKTRLTTYCARCIENEILMFLRKNNRIKTEVSFDEPLNTDWDGNELLLSDILGTEEDIITKDLELKVDKQLLKNALKTLNDREKQIMELRFGLIGKEEKTQKDVADMLGISQSYISRLEKKIIRRLQKEIEKMV